ncbi:hypothetical protein niasHT_013712 [Heterodera trifolii]|uniref:Uncharacterized protein n=1 Tax=Heterodera trifolii TaxID=157864 RepID=A0ABD2LC66_9BILA
MRFINRFLSKNDQILSSRRCISFCAFVEGPACQAASWMRSSRRSTARLHIASRMKKTARGRTYSGRLQHPEGVDASSPTAAPDPRPTGRDHLEGQPLASSSLHGLRSPTRNSNNSAKRPRPPSGRSRRSSESTRRPSSCATSMDRRSSQRMASRRSSSTSPVDEYHRCRPEQQQRSRVVFGADVVESVRNLLGIDYIVRAHQLVMNGVQYFVDRHL